MWRSSVNYTFDVRQTYNFEPGEAVEGLIACGSERRATRSPRMLDTVLSLGDAAADGVIMVLRSEYEMEHGSALYSLERAGIPVKAILTFGRKANWIDGITQSHFAIIARSDPNLVFCQAYRPQYARSNFMHRPWLWTDVRLPATHGKHGRLSLASGPESPTVTLTATKA